ncbi:hypothetical protein QTP88_006937 [Uroleucon formosanum]
MIIIIKYYRIKYVKFICQQLRDDNGNAMQFIGIPNTMNTIDYEFTTVETSLVITHYLQLMSHDAQKRKKKKEDLLMTSVVKCNKLAEFFSLTNKSDDKPVSNVIETGHSISKENINNETNINCNLFNIN